MILDEIIFTSISPEISRNFRYSPVTTGIRAGTVFDMLGTGFTQFRYVLAGTERDP